MQIMKYEQLNLIKNNMKKNIIMKKFGYVYHFIQI